MNQNTNYRNFSKQNDNEPKVTAPITEPVVTTNVDIELEEVKVKPVVLTGVVTGCKKLNVRKEADKDSDVLCVIDKGAEVQLYDGYNADYDFYKVCTAEGVEGYCMQQYIMLTKPKN